MKITTVRDRYHTFNMIFLLACAPFFFIAAFVGLIVLGLTLFSHSTEITHFDAAQIMYRHFGNEYRDDYLAAGQPLANDLIDSNVDEAKKLEIEPRLEQLRSEISWSELNLIEQDKWSRIDSAIRLRHLQERQIADIEAKRCDAITAASISADGNQTSSPVEVVCQ